MCRFVAIAVKEKQAAYEVLEGYRVTENMNGTLVNAVPKEYAWLWITDGYCSCDFYAPAIDLEEEIKKIRGKYSKPKYKKRGWNERRIKDKIDGLRQKRISRPGGLSEPLYEAIRKYVKNFGECFFLVGWVSGYPDKELFPIKEAEDFEILSENKSPSWVCENLLYRMI